MSNRIAIIGGGFCGLMTTYHLIRKSTSRLHIYLINAGYKTGTGIAYGTASEKFLLNVPVAKMTAIPGQPDHFLKWLHQHHPYNLIDQELLGKMFVPRKEYGNYLSELLNELVKNPGNHQLEIIEAFATDVTANDGGYDIACDSGKLIYADKVVLATGNEKPADPYVANNTAFSCDQYFGNPWNEESFRNLPEQKNILIIGNGLTMVDTVLGLIENNCQGTIYSLSPHGFTILPHRHAGIVYTKLLEEIKEPLTINSLFTLFHRHTRILRHFGLTAEPVVDSVRPLAQRIWKEIGHDDKKRFLRHVRHLWGVARHRLPLHIYDLIQNLRIRNKLIVCKGKLISLEQKGDDIMVKYYDGNSHSEKIISVGRIINCTGPSLNINKSSSPLIQSLLRNKLIRPDALFLGIDTDENGQLIREDGAPAVNLFTLGGNLRGLLWESTAVPELRVQAEKLAAHLIA